MVDIRSPGLPDSATLAKTTGELAKENVAGGAQLAKGSFAGEQVVIVKDAGLLATEAQEAGLVSEDVERELRQQGRRVFPEDQPGAAPKALVHGRSMAPARGLRARQASSRQLSNRAADRAERLESEISASDSPATAPLASLSEAEEHFRQPADLQARKDEVEDLGRAMQAAGLTDPGDIIEFVRKNLGERPGQGGGNNDPTLQYGALAIIQQMFAAEGQQALADAVGAAATRLLADHALAIQKGAIVTDAAAAYASERFGSVSNLRSLYMEEVVAHEGIPTTFYAIVEKYGDAGFADAVGFLLKAASNDLATITIDVDRIRQKDVLDNLYTFEVLNTLRERGDDALQRIDKNFPVTPGVTGLKVVTQIFKWIENPGQVGPAAINRFAHEMVPGSVEGRISFLRELRALVATFPLKIFDQAEEGSAGVRLRERVLDAIVAAQDIADKEEGDAIAVAQEKHGP